MPGEFCRHLIEISGFSVIFATKLAQHLHMPIFDRLSTLGIYRFLLRLFRRGNVENGMSETHFDIPEYVSSRGNSNSIDRLKHRIDSLDRRIGSMDNSGSDRSSYLEDLEAQIDDINDELSDLRCEIDDLDDCRKCGCGDSEEDKW